VPTFLRSLRFQITAALLGLLLLFATSSIHTFQAFNETRANEQVIRLASQLPFLIRHMADQAENYKRHAPRDYETYNRDLSLYYQDLMNNTRQISQVLQALEDGQMSGDMPGMPDNLVFVLSPQSKALADELAKQWKSYLREAMDRLGPDKSQPRLEWAAQHIVADIPQLERVANQLSTTLTADTIQRSQRTDFINRVVLTVAIVLALGILGWFYQKVLRPLNKTVQGFNEVAAGNFDYRVPVTEENELGALAKAFNLLTIRLDTLFQLITRLQQGSNLDETVGFVAETCPHLLPLDWVGVLFQAGPDHMRLESAYSDGHAEPPRGQRFPFNNTLLEECLNTGQLLHIADINALAHSTPEYRFLGFLGERQRHEAIFLPLTEQSPLPGVLVFATRQQNAYSADHKTLLSNIGLLMTLSFGRTLKLAEHQRLAAIGQFASSITHELRNPLATIRLALEYVHKEPLSEGSSKRLAIANDEIARMTRLLEDMLLYAKPLQLQLATIDLTALLKDIIAQHQDMAAHKGVEVHLDAPGSAVMVSADKDRLRQLFINLLRNAIEAAPATSVVDCKVPPPHDQMQRVRIHNQGEPIAAEQQGRLFEPFFTTKAGGSGLGLAIARRMAEAHGGEIKVESSQNEGTYFEVQLPLNQDDT